MTQIAEHGTIAIPEATATQAATSLEDCDIAIPDLVDVFFLVAALAQARRAFRYASLAGSPVYRSHPRSQRRYRLFPDPDGAGG